MSLRPIPPAAFTGQAFAARICAAGASRARPQGLREAAGRKCGASG